MTESLPNTPETIISEWVSNMDNALTYFEVQTGIAFDGTAESLNKMEQWLLARYPTSKAILVEGEADYLDTSARFVGEVFRRQLGGSWEIVLDDPKNAHYGLPRLNGFRDQGIPFCPQLQVTTALARRTGSYLATRLAVRLEDMAKAP